MQLDLGVFQVYKQWELDLYIDLIGKPFEFGSRGPNTFDCYGLCMEVYKRLGRELPDYPTSFGNYTEDNETYVNGKANFIRLEKPVPFCLVTFMIIRPFVSHVGVVTEDCTHFLSAEVKRFVSIEPLESPRWRGRLDGFWKYEIN